MIPTTDDHLIQDEGLHLRPKEPHPPTPYHLTPLTSADDIFLRLEGSGCNMNIVMIGTFPGPLDIDLVHGQIETLVRERPRFRQVAKPATKTHPAYWSDDPHFHLNRHIKERRFPPSRSSLLHLQQYVGRWIAPPFHPDHPPWEIRILYGIDVDGKAAHGESSPQGSALFLRAHHCISDGQGFVIALLHMLSTSDPASIPIIPAITPTPLRPRRKFLSSLRAAALGLCTTLVESRNILFYKQHIPYSFDKALSGKDMAWVDLCSTEDIARLRQLHPGSTLNDVIVTVLTQAIRHVLSRHGLPLRDKLYLHIPISLRAPDNTDLSNNIAVGHLFSPFIPRPHAHGIRDARTAMNAVKSSWTPHLAARNRTVSLHPSTRLTILSMGKSDGVLTNIRGSPHPLHFAGQPLRHLSVLPPQMRPGSLGMSILSHQERIIFSIVTDTSPNQVGLVDDICTELASEIKALLQRCPRKVEAPC